MDIILSFSFKKLEGLFMENSEVIKIPEKYTSELDESILHSLDFWRERTTSFLTSSGPYSKPLSNRIKNIVENISMAYYLRERGEFLDCAKYDDDYWKYWVFENHTKLHRPNLNFNDVRDEIDKLTFVISRLMRKEYGVIEGEEILINLFRTVEGIYCEVEEFTDHQLKVFIVCSLTSESTELTRIKIEAGWAWADRFENPLPFPHYYTPAPYQSPEYERRIQERIWIENENFYTNFRNLYYSKTHSRSDRGSQTLHLHLKDDDFGHTPIYPEGVHYTDDDYKPYLTPLHHWYWVHWPSEIYRLEAGIIFAVRVVIHWTDWHLIFPELCSEKLLIYQKDYKPLELRDDDTTPPVYQELRNKFSNENTYIPGFRYCGVSKPTQDFIAEIGYLDTGWKRGSPIAPLNYTLLLKNTDGEILNELSGDIEFTGTFLSPDEKEWEGWAPVIIPHEFWDNYYNDLDTVVITHKAKDLDGESYTVNVPVDLIYKPTHPEWEFEPRSRDDTLSSIQYSNVLLKKIEGIAIKPYIDLEFKDNIQEDSKPYPGEHIGLYCEFFNPQDLDATVTGLSFAIVPKNAPKPSQWHSYQSFQQILLEPDRGRGGVFSPILTDPNFIQDKIGEYDIWVKYEYIQSGLNNTEEKKGMTFQVIIPEKPSVEYSSTINDKTTSHTDSGTYQMSFPFRTDIDSVQGNYKPYKQLLTVKITNKSRVLLKFNSDDRNPKFTEDITHDDPKKGISIYLKGDSINLIKEETTIDYLPTQINPGSSFSIDYYMQVNDTTVVKTNNVYDIVDAIFEKVEFGLVVWDLSELIHKSLRELRPSYYGIAFSLLEFTVGYNEYIDIIDNLIRLLEESKVHLEEAYYTFSNVGNRREWTNTPGDCIFNDTLIHVLAVPSVGQLKSLGEYLDWLDLKIRLDAASVIVGLFGLALPVVGTVIAWGVSVGLAIGGLCASDQAEEAFDKCNYIDPPELAYKEEVTVSSPKKIEIPDLVVSHPKLHHPIRQLKTKTKSISNISSALKLMYERKTQAGSQNDYNSATMHLKNIYSNFKNFKAFKIDSKTQFIQLMNLTIDFLGENQIDDMYFLNTQDSIRENGLNQEIIDLLQKGKNKNQKPGKNGYLTIEQTDRIKATLESNYTVKTEDIKKNIIKINDNKELHRLHNEEVCGMIKDQYIDTMVKLEESDATVELYKEPSIAQLEELEKLKTDILNANSLNFHSEVKRLCDVLKHKTNDLMFELVNNKNVTLNEFVEFANEYYFAAQEKEFIKITDVSLPPEKLEHNEKAIFKLYISAKKEHIFILNLDFFINYQQTQDAKMKINGLVLKQNSFEIQPETIYELKVEFYLNDSIITYGKQDLVLRFWTDYEEFKDIVFKRIYNVELIDEDNKINSLINIDYQGDYTDANYGVWEVKVDNPPGATSDIKVLVNDEFAGSDQGTYEVPNELGDHRIWVETKIRDLKNEQLDPDIGLKTNTVKVYDDDSQIPIINIEYTGDGTDGKPGAFQWKIIEESGLSELQIKIEYRSSPDSIATEYLPPPTSEGKWDLSDLGFYSIYVFASDNDKDRTLLIDSLSAEVKESQQLIDDDILSPIITNMQISKTLEEVIVIFDAFDKKMGDDRGFGRINLYIDGELVQSLTSIPPDQTHFEVRLENKWNLKLGDHSILVEIWDMDDDRDFDSLKTEARGSFYTEFEFMKTQLMNKIGNFLKDISESPEEHWIDNRKKVIINKIELTENLVFNDQFTKAYNYFLRTIKPKLTGLLQNELGDTSGLFSSNELWLTDDTLKQKLLIIINQILENLRIFMQDYESKVKRSDFMWKIWPSHNEISLLAYYAYLDRERNSRPMMIDNEEMDFLEIHYKLAKITFLLEFRFLDYLNILGNSFFIVDKPYFIDIYPGYSKLEAIKWQAYKFAQRNFEHLQKYFALPNFGSWHELEVNHYQDPFFSVTGKSKIIENARKISNLNLRFDLLDWFLAENTLLLTRFSQPYRHNIHPFELYLFSLLDEESRQILWQNGIDSLALLNDFNKETLSEILDMNKLNFDQLKEDLSKIIWL